MKHFLIKHSSLSYLSKLKNRYLISNLLKEIPVVIKSTMILLSLLIPVFAQSISISGKIINISGNAVQKATVQLKNIQLITTTKSDGSFILSNEASSITDTENLKNTCQFNICNNIIYSNMFNKNEVKIKTYDLDGRLVSYSKHIPQEGKIDFSYHLLSNGVHIHTIETNNYSVILHSINIGNQFKYHRRILQSRGNSQDKTADVSVFNDEITVIKDGYLNFSQSITNPDTTGIKIKLIDCADTLVDPDGNIYQAVKIGNQIWTVENYRSTKNSDGTSIPLRTDGWEIRLWTQNAYCYINNTTDTASIRKYGALYNWFVVRMPEFAPSGWRVPSKNDWITLQNYLINNGYNWDGTTEENKIAKALSAKTDWPFCSTIGTVGNNLQKNNITGFNALPTGYRNGDGDFLLVDSCCLWWTNFNNNDVGSAYYFLVSYAKQNLVNSFYLQRSAMSVRFVKDSE